MQNFTKLYVKPHAFPWDESLAESGKELAEYLWKCGNLIQKLLGVNVKGSASEFICQ